MHGAGSRRGNSPPVLLLLTTALANLGLRQLHPVPANPQNRQLASASPRRTGRCCPFVSHVRARPRSCAAEEQLRRQCRHLRQMDLPRELRRRAFAHVPQGRIDEVRGAQLSFAASPCYGAIRLLATAGCGIPAILKAVVLKPPHYKKHASPSSPRVRLITAGDGRTLSWRDGCQSSSPSSQRSALWNSSLLRTLQTSIRFF